jgi:endoribonuclease LACTB2
MPERKEKLFGGEGARDPYKIWPEDKFVPLKDGQIFRVDEENTLRIMHTPGHANDHVTIFHEEEKAMFTGDNVLGVGTSVFRNLADYMDSLKKMERVCRENRVQRLYPSHGPILDDRSPGETITAYIKHRQSRIDQVRAVLERGGEYTAEEVTRIVYPKDKYPEHLILAAMGNTNQVLLALCRDGVAISSSSSTSSSTMMKKWRIVNDGGGDSNNSSHL